MGYRPNVAKAQRLSPSFWSLKGRAPKPPPPTRRPWLKQPRRRGWLPIQGRWCLQPLVIRFEPRGARQNFETKPHIPRKNKPPQNQHQQKESTRCQRNVRFVAPDSNVFGIQRRNHDCDENQPAVIADHGNRIERKHDQNAPQPASEIYESYFHEMRIITLKVGTTAADPLVNQHCHSSCLTEQRLPSVLKTSLISCSLEH